MSASVAPPAEHRPPPVAAPRSGGSRLRLRPPEPASYFFLALTFALSALSLWGRGGLQLETATHVQLTVLAVAALLGITAACAAGTRRWWGTATVAAFGLYAAACAASILWSVEPSESWVEGNRVLAWLAIFAAGIALVRAAGQWWKAVLGAIVAAAVIVCAWGLLTKIFPETFSPDETYARLRQPYEYWNAIGLTAALGIVSAVWLGARRGGNGLLSALAFPATGLLTVALVLAYSRGALLALVLALAVWFLFVPLRIRSAAVVAIGGIGGALISIWAVSQDTLTTNNVPPADRATSGLQLGSLLLIVMALQLFGGIAVRFRADGPPLPAARRRRIGVALLVALLLVPCAVVGKLALSNKGLSGSISSGWKALTDPNDTTKVGNDPSRLTTVASVRAKYWQEAYKVAKDHKWKGVGAGGYAVARSRYQTGTTPVRHVHNYVMQAAADLGALGVGVTLLLLACWLAAAARTLGAGRGIAARLRRRPTPAPLPWDAERVGLAAMGVVVVAFGIHSFVDWTWYVPGNVAVALLCAGWVAGRGPLTEVAAAPGLLGQRLARGVREPWRIAAAVAILTAALIAGWSTWRPLAADQAAAKAQATAAANPITNAAALKEAVHAADLDPLAVEPLYAEAYVHVIGGRKPAAREALVKAVRLQPANPDTWLQLADFTLNQLNKPAEAQRLLGPALYLDPQSRAAAIIYLKASRISAEQAQRVAARRAAAEQRAKAKKSKK